MSSTGSPTLIIDAARRRTEAAAMAFTVGGGAGAPWLIDALPPWAAALACGFVATALILGFLRAGWWGAARIVSASWSADGPWRLTLGSGRSLEASLDARTRVAGRLVWLCWREEGPSFRRRRAMLLTHFDLPTADFRRLVARLRLDGRAVGLNGVAPAVVAA